MSSSAAIVLSPRDRWLADAHLSIGASELPALLGQDPYRGEFSIYEAKVNRKLDEPEEAWLAFGRDVEGAILKAYARKTGFEVFHNAAGDLQRFYHPDNARLSATPDGLVKTPKRTAEAKAVAIWKRNEWHEDQPLRFEIQVQAQMACAGYPEGDLVALLGGVLLEGPITFTPNPGFMTAALEAVDRFWWHVENRKPPAPDGKPGTRAAIGRLWPTDSGEAIALGQDVKALVEDWEFAKHQTRLAEDREAELQNRIRVAMGEARVGFLPDKSTLVLRRSRNGGRPLKRFFPHQMRSALKSAHGERS